MCLNAIVSELTSPLITILALTMLMNEHCRLLLENALRAKENLFTRERR